MAPALGGADTIDTAARAGWLSVPIRQSAGISVAASGPIATSGGE